ncbi:MAG: DUF951 domain-containing protein [Bacillota bacterium]
MERPIKLRIGDVVELKKTHPCGNSKWEITRTGIDIGLKCLGCGRKVMIPRVKLERAIRKLIPQEAQGGDAIHEGEGT